MSVPTYSIQRTETGEVLQEGEIPQGARVFFQGSDDAPIQKISLHNEGGSVWASYRPPTNLGVSVHFSQPEAELGNLRWRAPPKPPQHHIEPIDSRQPPTLGISEGLHVYTNLLENGPSKCRVSWLGQYGEVIHECVLPKDTPTAVGFVSFTSSFPVKQKITIQPAIGQDNWLAYTISDERGAQCFYELPSNNQEDTGWK